MHFHPKMSVTEQFYKKKLWFNDTPLIANYSETLGIEEPETRRHQDYGRQTTSSAADTSVDAHSKRTVNVTVAGYDRRISIACSIRYHIPDYLAGSDRPCAEFLFT
jgi:hypothetical protein